MKHRADRWKRFSEQSELQVLKNKYTFERFEGINGSAIDIQNDSRISLRTKRNIKDHTRRDHEELDSAGGVGCYLSHTGIWKKFLERSEPYAIIFEDDAAIPEGFTEDLEIAMKQSTLLPQTPDVWFFSMPCTWYYDYKGKPMPQDVKGQVLGPWIINTCASFTGYLISKKGAEKLLEQAFPLDMHVDIYTCLNNELKRVFTVANKNVLVKPLSVKDNDTDIQSGKECRICDVPTNFSRRGIVVVNIPILILCLASIYGMYSLRGGIRRR